VSLGPSAVSRAAPGIHVELLFVGLAVALLIPALILTPLGKASGGHMNPAISFGMWWLGVFPRRAVIPYTIAQLAGSLLGVVLARLVCGPPIARLLAPIASAALAAWLVRRCQRRRVLTHHLSGKHVETADEARLTRHRRPDP
jgi:glycerol uptake facilitator-like aquaporin